MCGIAGLWDLQSQNHRSDQIRNVRHMCGTIAHRGPDSDGVWADENGASPVLGHRRLAIIDLSDDGAQPMHSASKRYSLVYNGEIYNFQSIRSELEKKGHQFRGFSDTEVFLGAVEQWGLNHALQKINGMFAIALWDSQEKRMHFVRDRMGKKPLYIGWIGSTLAFASEAKAFHVFSDFKPEVDKEALASVISRGYVVAPHSIYKNIFQLLPGHRLSISAADDREGFSIVESMEPYWVAHEYMVPSDQCKEVDDIYALDQFEEILSQCVADRMVSDVPLGAFLSGGIDSSAIVALMQKQSSRPIQTYTIGFGEAEYNEAHHAREIAEHLGCKHHEIILNTQQALDVVMHLPQIYDEPFADASQIPTYLVSQFTRNHVTVALSGDGGDEMLGGYNRHLFAPAIWKRIKLLPRWSRRLLSHMLAYIPAQKWPDFIQKQHPQFRDALPKILRILDCRDERDLYLRLLGATSMTQQIVPSAQLVDTGNGGGNLTTLRDEVMYWDFDLYLPNGVLTKVDRASMAASLEVRAPLLDRRVFEYCWQLPYQMKVRDGQGKWLLRQLLKRYVPEKLFNRPKQGFSVPIADWLRGDLKDWAGALLFDRKSLEFDMLDHTVIQRLWQEHQSGQFNHAQILWNILMTLSWYQRWM